MRGRNVWLAAGLIAGFWIGRGAGDEILLKGGNVVQGRIIAETDAGVIVEIKLPAAPQGSERFIKMTFSRDRIERISRGANLFAEEGKEGQAKPADDLGGVETPTPAPAEAAAPAEAVKGDEKPAATGKSTEKKIDPALQAQIDKLIAGIGGTDAKADGDREARLVAIGKDAVPALTKALGEATGNAALTLIQCLEKIGDKLAVYTLFKHLDGGPRDKVRMKRAWQALKALTGQEIRFDEEKGPARRKQYIADWEAWIKENKNRLPRQLGVNEAEFYGPKGYQGQD